MYSVVVDELLCSQSVEAVHKLLFVKQEGLEPIVEGATVSHTVLVRFVHLPKNCTKGRTTCKEITSYTETHPCY